jgi:Leucine-rich repeat (LRR) protein
MAQARKRSTRELDLSYLKLRTLPEAIGQLSQLQWLNLSNNQLSSLSEAIGRLSQLQQLRLSFNQLNTLPEALQSLERLEKLFLHGNHGLRLPEEVLGPAYQVGVGAQRSPPQAPARNPRLLLCDARG